MSDLFLINNLWVLIASILVFLMTIAIGFLEMGELGKHYSGGLLKTILISGLSVFFMAFIGFNIAFAPTVYGIIGIPNYTGFFFGGLSYNAAAVISSTWWSMTNQYFATGLTTGTYFLFETAFASVTLAIVAVIVLRKVKMSAFIAYSAIYFILIWTLPAAWIWNPTGWLYLLGVRDFGGGLVVHAAAGIAGLAFVVKIWQEEKKRGFKESPQIPTSINSGWLTLSTLLLWFGWFGFNTGSVLAFNEETIVVGLNTFLGASSALVSTLLFRYLITRKSPGYIYAVNGILVGLILMSPLSGYISPLVAVVVGFVGGPLFLLGERLMSRKWYSDPIGLFPTHLLCGASGFILIAFISQSAYASLAGAPNLPNGILFGGGMLALRQLGVESLAIVVVFAFVFTLSYVSLWIIGKFTKGITNDYDEELVNAASGIITAPSASPASSFNGVKK
ncbi:MAG: ammonium transporter [Thermoplasmatales archaeon]